MFWPQRVPPDRDSVHPDSRYQSIPQEQLNPYAYAPPVKEGQGAKAVLVPFHTKSENKID